MQYGIDELERLLKPVAGGKAYLPAWREPSWRHGYIEGIVAALARESIGFDL